MSDKLTDNEILSAAAKAGVELSPSDVAHISAQFDGFAVLKRVDVSDTQPMFDFGGDGECRIARRQ